MCCLWFHKHLTQLMLQNTGKVVVVVTMTLHMDCSKLNDL